MRKNIRELQLTQLAMLAEIDRVCKKYKIEYQLFAGTALGAVRHQGFIPWDDDLDILMTRENYDKFMKLGEKELDQERYFLQKEFSEHWPMFFSKLRLNNTAFMERYYPKDKETHQGVYIDIFPCDNLDDNKFVRKLQYYASKIVIAKCLDKRGYLTDSMKKKVFIGVCRMLPMSPFLKLGQMRWKKNTKMMHSFFGASSKYEKSIYKREWIVENVKKTFEDSDYPVSAHYDILLTTLYGDYMTPTPEHERVYKVHAEIIDLNKSYTEYLDEQRKRIFTEYTRSIR